MSQIKFYGVVSGPVIEKQFRRSARIQGKARTALRRLARLGAFAFNAIWAIPSVMFIRIMRPWMRVQMGSIESSRIGHFVADASVFLAWHSLQPQQNRTVELFWFSEPTCNQQWARMVRRQLFVRRWVKYLDYFNRRIPGGAFHELSPATAAVNMGVYSILRQTTARFDFVPREKEIAKAWLRRRGWRDGEKFVCLLARDSAYLSSHTLHSNGCSDRWSYHYYRDSDIDSYIEAIRTLVEKGYWVIRMGKIVQKRLSLQHPRVIDYPFAEDQDDLIDICKRPVIPVVAGRRPS